MSKELHHLFSYPIIRKEIVKIFGEPKTDEEHKFIQKKTNEAHKRMPKYLVSKEKHREIHGLKNKEARWRKNEESLEY